MKAALVVSTGENLTETVIGKIRPRDLSTVKAHEAGEAAVPFYILWA